MKRQYIYLCGPTVYNKVHIGNMRPIVTFDLILRGMKFLNNNIYFIHNITDIDDKIIAQAQKERIDEEEISSKYFEFYKQMLKEFNIETIDIMPKVSEKIKLIENFINSLKDKDYVYESNGSYYFKTSKLKEYGEVSKNDLDNLKSEDDNKDKENAFDFALWKNKSEGKTWNTSLGQGRPGWHTECAAFIYENTKEESLLIHGGGIDLKFPHHENENAQFRALTNNPITKEWLHVGIINYKNQKMSKSLGNILFTDEFLHKYNSSTNAADLFRLLILSSSIKSTIELSDKLIESLIKKNNQIKKIVNYVLLNKLTIKKTTKVDNSIIEDLSKAKFSNIYKKLNELIKEFNSKKENDIAIKIFDLISFLGFTITNISIDTEYIEIYEEWKQEINNKNYKKADQLRQILMEKELI